MSTGSVPDEQMIAYGVLAPLALPIVLVMILDDAMAVDCGAGYAMLAAVSVYAAAFAVVFWWFVRRGKGRCGKALRSGSA